MDIVENRLDLAGDVLALDKLPCARKDKIVMRTKNEEENRTVTVVTLIQPE